MTAQRPPFPPQLLKATILGLLVSLHSPLAPAQSPAITNSTRSNCGVNILSHGNDLECLSDEALANLRGGFRDGGILIGFGFERVVSIDGEIQEHTIAALPVLNLSEGISIVPANRLLQLDSESIRLEGLTQWSSQALSLREINTGAPYNAMEAQVQIVNTSAALDAMMSNVIQNTLDERTIEQIRSIDIEIFGLGDVPKFDTQQHLIPSLIESLGQ